MGDGLAAPHAKEIKKKMAQKDAKGKTAERQPALTFALTILAPLQSAPHIKQNTRGKPWAKLSRAPSGRGSLPRESDWKTHWQ
jgi:hypothetical protein